MTDDAYASNDVLNGRKGRNRNVERWTVLVVLCQSLQICKYSATSVESWKQVFLNEFNNLDIALSDGLVPPFMTLSNVSSCSRFIATIKHYPFGKLIFQPLAHFLRAVTSGS
jgi:hypothetical protein